MKTSKKKEIVALIVPINTTAIVVKTRSISTLTKREDLEELKRSREIYRAAVTYAKTLKGGRPKLLEAATFQLRTEIQIGAILQEMAKGSDVTDTRYEDFLQEQTITHSQAARWRDMGYSLAKKLGKALDSSSLKFSPEFFKKFDEYIADCGNDPSGVAVPSYNGFVNFLHETDAAREKRYRIQVLTTFCRNVSFLEAEAIYKRVRVAEYLDVAYPEGAFQNATEAFDKLVWKEVLDKRNLFFGQATEMNRRDEAKTNAI